MIIREHTPTIARVESASKLSSRIVLFGGNGDLSRRMLFPSLYLLDRDGLLPEGLSIVAVDRSISETEPLREDLQKIVASNPQVQNIDTQVWHRGRLG